MYEHIDRMVVVGGVEHELLLQVQEACHLHHCPLMGLSVCLAFVYQVQVLGVHQHHTLNELINWNEDDIGNSHC